jgi:hypothetical protein
MSDERANMGGKISMLDGEAVNFPSAVEID